MYFSDVVAEVKNGSWVLNEKSPLVYQIVKPNVTIQFYPEKTIMLIGENEYDVSLTDFSKIAFTDREEKKESGEIEIKSTLEFDNQEQFELIENKMTPYKELFGKLAELC